MAKTKNLGWSKKNEKSERHRLKGCALRYNFQTVLPSDFETKCGRFGVSASKKPQNMGTVVAN